MTRIDRTKKQPIRATISFTGTASLTPFGEDVALTVEVDSEAELIEVMREVGQAVPEREIHVERESP